MLCARVDLFICTFKWYFIPKSATLTHCAYSLADIVVDGSGCLHGMVVSHNPYPDGHQNEPDSHEEWVSVVGFLDRFVQELPRERDRIMVVGKLAIWWFLGPCRAW